MLLRSHVAGADDSIHTSEIFHSAISRSTPRVFLKSSPIDNLFFVTSASSPPWGRGPRPNCGADKTKKGLARFLTLITSKARRRKFSPSPTSHCSRVPPPSDGQSENTPFHPPFQSHSSL